MAARTVTDHPPAPFRRTAAALVLALVTVLLAACSASETPPQPPPSPVPPQLAAFYDQKPAWGPCGSFATTSMDAVQYADPKFDCAKVRVPLDYDRPDGPTAEIAMLRQKAAGNRIGSVFLDPGGPGASGASFLAGRSETLTGSPLADRFDMIGFDPRGTGASTPTIDCLDDRENDQERAKVFVDPSPAGVAAAEADSKLFADRCAQRVGPDVLAHMGTRDAAKDMDVLRSVVGDPKMTYVGFSYGTELGTSYAEQFPRNVRAMVLDGAVDPTESTIDHAVKQAAGFQLAFDNFAKWCAAQPQRRSPCPLGTDPSQAVRRYQAIMQTLIDRPVPVGDGRVLSFEDAQTGVTQALYESEIYPFLSQGISEVASGSGRLLMRLADLYYRRDDSGRYSNMLEAFNAISCMDTPPVTDPAQVRQLAERNAAAAPFQSTGRAPVAARDSCAFWPVPPTGAPHRAEAPGLPPVVVVAVTGDPATPYQEGVDLSQQLGGSLIAVDGEQHTASLDGNRCLDGKVMSYLIDLTLPEEGARCTLAPS